MTNADLGDKGSSDESDSDSEEELTRDQKKIANKLDSKTESELRKKLKKAGRSTKGTRPKLTRRLVLWEDEEGGTSGSENSSSDGSDSDSDSDSDGGRGSPARLRQVRKKFESLDQAKLKDLCRAQTLRHVGTKDELVDRLAQAEIDKESGGSKKKEKDPKRQKLREKYEKMKQYELQRLLKNEYKDANGTKEALVDRILEWKMPRDSDDETDEAGDSDRESLRDMSLDQLRKLARKCDLDDGGSVKKLRARLLEDGVSPRASSTSPKRLFFGNSSMDSDDDDDGQSRKSVERKYKDMTRSQLKKMCKDSWLDEDGDKDDLIERLVKYEKPSGGWGGSGGSGSKKKKKKGKSGSGGGTDLWGDDGDDSDDEDSSSDDGGSSSARKRKKEKREVEKKLASLSKAKLIQLCRKKKMKDTGTEVRELAACCMLHAACCVLLALFPTSQLVPNCH